MIAELIELFLTFFRIGFFTIGGGLAMLPMIQQELVDAGRMTMRDAIDMVALSEMTPGPFAVNSATFAGMRLYGVAGALAATLGVVAPSFIICLIIAKRFFSALDAPVTKAVFKGLRPVVYALILSAMLTVCSSALAPMGLGNLNGLFDVDWAVFGIAVVGSFALVKFKLNPIIIICAAAGIGALFLR